MLVSTHHLFTSIPFVRWYLWRPWVIFLKHRLRLLLMSVWIHILPSILVGGHRMPFRPTLEILRTWHFVMPLISTYILKMPCLVLNLHFIRTVDVWFKLKLVWCQPSRSQYFLLSTLILIYYRRIIHVSLLRRYMRCFDGMTSLPIKPITTSIMRDASCLFSATRHCCDMIEPCSWFWWRHILRLMNHRQFASW